jgi:hypothetical protein
VHLLPGNPSTAPLSRPWSGGGCRSILPAVRACSPAHQGRGFQGFWRLSFPVGLGNRPLLFGTGPFNGRLAFIHPYIQRREDQ